MAEEFDGSEKEPGQPAGKKQKVPLEVQEQRLAPKPSPWPIALAFTLAIIFMGVILHPIILICGIVLTIGVIIGWVLEKQ